MRVLMVAELYPPFIGGTEEYVRNLARALVERGHNVTVATMAAPGDGASVATEDGVVVHRLLGSTARLGRPASGRPYSPPAPDPELVVALRRVLADARPDVVHAHNWMVHSFLPLKGTGGAALVATLHDYGVVCAKRNLLYRGRECSGPGFEKCLRCASRHYGSTRGPLITLANWGFGVPLRAAVDMWIPVSRAVARGNQLERLALPYEVVPNFVPDDVVTRADEDHPALAQLPRPGFWLYVGALSRHKGITNLLDAYRGIPGAPPLVVVGRRHEEAPESYPEGVRPLLDLPHAAVMAIWRRAGLAIVPSVFPDPCPTVALEAMAAGVPIVGSRSGGLPDIVVDGETGLLVEPGDVAALRRVLCRVLVDDAERARMAALALARAPHYMSAAVVGRLEAIYTQVAT